MITALEVSEVEQKALSIPDQAKALVVSSNEEYLAGESLLANCKELEAQIHEAFDGIVEKAHSAHKEAVAQRKKYLDPLEEGRRILKSKMIVYQDEMEKARHEAQRKAEEDAKARAEEEALDAAIAAEQAGDKEVAEAIISAPVEVSPIFIPKTAPAASRLSAGRSVWSCEVTNLMDLLKAIVAGTQPITLIEANMTALNGMARAQKGSMKIPGCRAIERKV